MGKSYFSRFEYSLDVARSNRIQFPLIIKLDDMSHLCEDSNPDVPGGNRQIQKPFRTDPLYLNVLSIRLE